MVIETSDRKPKNELDIKIGTEPQRIRPLTFKKKFTAPPLFELPSLDRRSHRRTFYRSAIARFVFAPSHLQEVM